MKICGYNKYSPFPEKSNNRSLCKEPCISPPCDPLLNVSSLLSYSCYSDHAVLIKNDLKAYAKGSNKGFRISKTLPAENFPNETEIVIKNSRKQPVKFLSAVCGYKYTLYLVSGGERRNNKLFYTQTYYNPLFLKINGHNPLKIYGGFSSSAAIDSGGSVIVITQMVFKNPKKALEASPLPNGEKAVCAACCIDSVLVLSASGKVFETISDIRKTSKIQFAEVKELEGKTFVHISGSYCHFLAVCDDGRVFYQDRIYESEAAKFTEISSLRNIVSASAGYKHSLFLTSKGEVFKDYSSNRLYSPETLITNGATFAIAGDYLSAVFVWVQPPPNTPNMSLHETPVESMSFAKACLEEANAALRSENESLQEQLVAKERQLAEASSEISKLRAKESSLEEEVRKLADENSTQKLEDERLKKMNYDLKKKIEKLLNPERTFEILDSDTVHSLRKIHRISSGASGEVFEVGKESKFALKVMHAGDKSTESCRNFMCEYESLTVLNHPNIVYGYGIYFGDGSTPLSILLELCVGNIQEAITKKSLTKTGTAKAIYQIAEGMKFVHSKGFIHRVLKPTNILIGKDGLIRISDFGISKLMTSEEQSTTLGMGTQKFMAPEILLEHKDYDEKVDVYSFGVVLFFILSGGEMPKINIIEVGTGKKADIPSDFTPIAKELISECWNFNAKTRPSFNEILGKLESNDYKVLDMSDTEINEVREFVLEHKKRIPLY